jgi:F0F1-type ATP synthase delta subunit
MKQPRTKLAKTIADQTLAHGASKEYAQEIAAYLLAENRVGDLDSILRDVQGDWAKAGFIEVLAHSAFPLTQSINDEITRQVKQVYPDAQEIRITEVHDPEVIGGVQLKLPNRQLDLSIEAKLNKFKQLTTAGKD